MGLDCQQSAMSARTSGGQSPGSACLNPPATRSAYWNTRSTMSAERAHSAIWAHSPDARQCR